MNTKEFVVKENEGFRLRVKTWKCVAPADLNSIEFTQECLKDDDVQMTSTYNYFLTDSEIEDLAKGLLTLVAKDSKVNA
jgi:hypothetical protein